MWGKLVTSVVALAALTVLVMTAQSASAATTVPAGALESDTVWDLAGSPYTLAGVVTVRNDSTLTLEPGVEVVLPSGARLDIGDPTRATATERGGRLLAEGNLTHPILFSGATLRFNGGSGAERDAVLRNVTFNGSTGWSVEAYSWSALLLDNVTFQSPVSGGLYLSLSSPTVRAATFVGGPRGIDATSWQSAPTVTGSRFVNQTVRHARLGITSHQEGNTFEGSGTGIELWGGNTWHTGDVTLRAAPGVYDLHQWAAFRGGATFTVEPGVTVRGANGAYLHVGDPSLQQTAGLRWRHGSYSATNVSLRFGPGVTGTGCDTPGPDALGYRCAEVAWNFTDISATGTLAGVQCDDCMSGAIPIGFPVSFYGKEYANVYVSSNGFLSFLPGQSAGCCSGHALPAPGNPDAVIAGYWEDLYPPSGAGSVRYQTLGTAPDRVFIAQWTEVAHYCCSANRVTFQIVLYENGTHADVNLRTVVSDGGAHVTGIESHNYADRRGRFLAEGTESAPITFESLSGSTSSGWQGLRFQGGNGAQWESALRNVTLRHVAGTALDLNAWSAITLDRVTIDRSSGTGLYVHGGVAPTVTNSTFHRTGSYSVLASSTPIALQDVHILAPSSHGVYLNGGASLTAVRLVVENATLYGIYGADNNRVTLTETVIQNATQRPMRVRLDSSLDGVTLSGNGIREIEYLGGDVTASATVRTLRELATGEVYQSLLVSTATVWNGARLTLEPGLQLRVAQNVGIQIGRYAYNDDRDLGHLTAEGTETDPILLTAQTGSASTGWYGLHFYEYTRRGTHVLRNVTVSLSRDDGIEASYSTGLTLDNVTLERNARYGLYASAYAYPTLVNGRISHNGNHGAYITSGSHPTFRGGIVENSTGYGVLIDSSSGFTADALEIANSTQRPARARLTDAVSLFVRGNGIREVEYWGGEITADREVRPLRDAVTGELHPAILLSSVTVRNNATFTLHPGVRLLANENVAISVGACCTASNRGHLRIPGTAAEPVLLTARTGSATTGWYGLSFYEYYGDGTHVLRNVTVSLSKDDAIEAAYSSYLTLDNVTLERNGRHGLYLTAYAYPHVVNSRISHNGNHGVSITSASHPTFRGGIVENSTGYGVLIDSASAFNAFGLEVSNSTQRPARARLIDPVSLTVRGNGIQEIEYWGWEVIADTTLTPLYDADSGTRLDAILLSSFTIRNSATLTIAPGTVLLVNENVGINVGACCTASNRGNLLIPGTAAEPVVLTARTGTSTKGWYGLNFYEYYGDGTHVLRNTTLSLSKDDAIEAAYSSYLTLDNVTLERNGRYGLYLTAYAYPQVVNSRISHNGNHGAYITSASHPTFRGGIVENSTGYGVYANSDSAFNAFGLEISNSTQRPTRARLIDPVTLVLRGNAIREIEYWGWDITTSATLRPHQDADTGELYPAVLLGSFTVWNQGTWTVEAGTTVLAATNVYVNVGRSSYGDSRDRGTLHVLGTTEEPVVFTSRTGLASTGWYGLYFNGYYGGGPSVLRNATFSLSKDDGIEAYHYSSLTLDNVTLERNARYGLHLSAASPLLQNVHSVRSGNHGIYLTNNAWPTIRGGLVENSTGYGVYAESSSSASILGLDIRNSTQRAARLRIDTGTLEVRLSGNAIQEIEYWGVDVTTSRSFGPKYDAASGEVYTSVLLGSFTVWNQATWTVDAGTRLELPYNTYINVGRSYWGDARDRGAIQVLGTTEAPVTFTSRTGNATTGWNGLYLYGNYGGGPSVLRNLTLSLSRDDGIEVAYYSALTMDNVTLERNARYGAYLTGSSPILHNVTVTHPGSHGVYLAGSSWPTFRGGLIENATGYGLYADSGANANVLDLEIRNATGRPARLRADAGLIGMTLSGNGIHEVELWGADVTTSRSLGTRFTSPEGETYTAVLLTSFTVYNQATWTVLEGTDVRVNENVAIQIGRSYWGDARDRGVLQVLGTEDAPVSFTSRTGNATTGWYGIYLYGYYGTGASVLRNVTLGLSKDDGIEAYAYSTLTLDNVTFDRNARSGLHATGGADPTVLGSRFLGGQYGVLSGDSGAHPSVRGSTFRNQSLAWMRVALGSATTGNTYEENGTAVQLFTAGLYSYSVTVLKDNVAYHLTDSPTFAWGSTLTLEAGVRLLARENVAIQIGRGYYGNSNDAGHLRVLGTASEPVLLSSATNASATGWYGLYLYGYYSSGTSVIRNATISLSKDDGAETYAYSSATFDNVTFDRNARSGLHATGGADPTVTASTFVGGQYGVLSGDTGAHPVVRGNTFRDQSVAWARVAIGTPTTGNTYEGTGTAVQLFTPGLTSTSATVYADNVVYHLTDSPTFAWGSTLTLQPGVRLHARENVAIQIGRTYYGNTNDRGHLVALGTKEAPIELSAATGSASTGWYGLHLNGYYSAGTATLRNVTVSLSKDDGIDAYYAPITLDNVTLSGNARYGLWSRDRVPTLVNVTTTGGTVGVRLERAHGFRLTDGDLSTPGGTALQLVDTDNGIVRGTRFTLSATGVSLDTASANNLLYDNLFLNTVNAQDAATTTQWNVTAHSARNVCGGPLVAGNCWSDYTGLDTDFDGIGDTDVPYRNGIAGTGDLAPLALGPWADFLAQTVNATLGLVQFTDATRSPMYPVTNWTWTFGDGARSYDRDPVHDYDLEALFNVTLTVRDSEGRERSIVKRLLIDTLPPVTQGALAGIRGQGPWWLTNVTVSLTASDNTGSVQEIFYRLGSIGDFLSYTNPFVVSAEGVTLLEYYAVDLGGNPERVKTLNLSIDKSDPVTSTVLDGTLHTSGWFRTNVLATLVGADATSGLNLTYYRLDGGDVTLYAGPVSITGTGIHTLDVFSRDHAGNLETAVRHTVRIDVTAPQSTLTLNGTAGTNGWYRGDVTANLTGSDQGSGLALLELGIDGALTPYDGARLITGDGEHTVLHRATDGVDHLGGLGSAVVRIDATAPALTLSVTGTRHATGWYVTAPTLYANATDATSGVASIEYRLNTGAWTLYTGPRSFTTDGSHVLRVRVTDQAGNVHEAPPVDLPIDLRAPVTGYTPSGTMGPGGWYRSDVTVTLSPGDGAGSGVLATTYSLDTGVPTPYTGPLTVRGEGQHTLNYTSTDMVGWVEDLRNRVLSIDLTRPLATGVAEGVQDANGTFTGPVTVTLTGTDALSGVYALDYRLNGGAWRRYTGPLSWDTSTVVNLVFRATDKAGNLGDLGYLNFTLELDVEPPVTTATLTGTRTHAPWWRSVVQVDLASVDRASGVDLIQYRVDGGDWRPYTGRFPISGDGVHTLEFHAVDLVGNLENVKALTVRVDATPPNASESVTGPAGLDGWFVGPATVTLSQQDLTSGPGRIDYSVNGGAMTLYTGPFTLSQSGQHLVRFVSVDVAGNPTTREFRVKVDADLPTVDLSAAGIEGNQSWFRSTVDVTLDAQDPTSGILALYYRVDVDGDWLPYDGPIRFTAEGKHRLQYYALDGSGTPGLVYEHTVLIDLTTPLAGLRLENTLFVEIRGHIYIQGSLCVEVTGLDLLSGVQDAYLRLTGAIRTLVYLDLAVSLQCFDPEYGAEGPIGIGMGVCDLAGHCEEEDMTVYLDGSAPSVDILRPFPGALNLQDASIPLFRTFFASPDISLEGELSGLEEYLPGEKLTLRLADARLAATTLVAGTRVPVWVRASDGGNPIDRVELFLDGVSVGVSTVPRNVTYERITWDRDENSYDPPRFYRENVTVLAYVFEVDTLTLPAGPHEFRAKAWDLPGRAANTLRLVSFVSPAMGNATADAVDAAIDGTLLPMPEQVPDEVASQVPPAPPLPEPLRTQAERAAFVARVFLKLYDTLVVDNYRYLDETVVDYYDAYGTLDGAPAQPPPLVYDQIGGPPSGGENQERIL